METASGEASYLINKSASGSITFEAKGLRVFKAIVFEILPLIIYSRQKTIRKQATSLASHIRLDLLIHIILCITCFCIVMILFILLWDPD